ncbi:Transport and Golgi organization 2 [Pelomyxa schiedti]|nr:Transport and Golgi organization 2 [Pelomyxa schiedti]
MHNFLVEEKPPHRPLLDITHRQILYSRKGVALLQWTFHHTLFSREKMCIIGLCLGVHNLFPFILCSNRDEYVNRGNVGVPPSLNEETGIIAGRDKLHSGTWLGLNTITGVFSAVNNVRSSTAKRSRGILVSSILAGTSATEVLQDKQEYAGFNLVYGKVLGDASNPKPAVYYATNRAPACPDSTATPTFQDGVFAMGNDIIGQEHVKVPYLTNGLQRVMKQHHAQWESTSTAAEEIRDSLAKLLNDTSIPPWSWLRIVEKFLPSRVRPLQPAFRTFLKVLALLTPIFLLLSLLMASSVASRIFCTLTASLILALVAGFGHHFKMQRIFIDVYPPFLGFLSSHRLATVSQTIILVSHEGEVFYYFRNTICGSKPVQDTPWTALLAHTQPPSRQGGDLPNKETNVGLEQSSGA